MGTWGRVSASSEVCLPSARVCAFLLRMGTRTNLWPRLALLPALAVGCGGDTSSTGAAPACNAAAPCGGVLDGTWRIDGTCVEGNLAAAMTTEANVPPACGGLFQSANITTVGTVTFANGMETDDVATKVAANIQYTSACASAVSGTTVALDAAACFALQQSLMDSGTFSSAICFFSNGSCACSVSSQGETDTIPRAYAISGSRVTYADGSDPMDYCVSGTDLTLRQTSADLPDVTLIMTLQRVPNPTGGTSSTGGATGAGGTGGAVGATATGGITASGGARSTGGSGPARTCNCSCFCGSCSGSTASGPTTKSCAAGDSSCVDCAAPCREFCTAISCSLMTLASGACG